MPVADNLDLIAAALVRRVLFITLGLALCGAGVGIIGIQQGSVTGAEAILVPCSFVFSFGILVVLLVRGIALQTIAVVATGFFTIYLCAGTLISILGAGQHLNLFIYLLWFFPLLAFNKLVNKPSIGQALSKMLFLAPLVLITCLMPWWLAVLRIEQQFLLGVYCLSYSCFASTVNIITRYREKYIVERERVGSLKVEADILESISDCFLSLDSNARLTYLNDAACAELGVDRETALHQTLSVAAPGFLSKATHAKLQAAATRSFASFFEVLSEESGQWHDLRCYPRPNGMSIYFRNITQSMLARIKLNEAQSDLRKQAELLDKAQDAIYLVDMNFRIVYWNKGAERVYGWTAEEVTGRLPADVFGYEAADYEERIGSILQHGEWNGEVSQYRRDGRSLIVDCRCTVVKDEEGTPQSILTMTTDITERKVDEARIEHQAYYDDLTGLPNRQLMRNRLAMALEASTVRQNAGALLYIDLDDFKTLNDTMGHDMGDELLRQVSRRLKDCLGPSDFVARLGGDEFVVMLADLFGDAQTAAAAAKTAGDKILEIFQRPFVLGSYESEVKASIGVTLFSGASDSVNQLLKRTDLAMYRAKAQGRNGLCFYDPSMQEEIETRAALRSDLRRALLRDGEFQLHYQPQVDIDGMVTGAEALLRWFHPVRGRVPPDKFIPLAEDAGLIVELGRWVLEAACRQIAAWASLPLMESLTVAVNVSVRQFLDPQFVHLVRETLRTSGANPRRLKLEITESSTMERISEVIAIMADLRGDGVSFSLDDFGTGYSSLSHLQHLPLDQLKIDRSFVNNVLTHAKDASIARTIIMLGHNLNLSVIAEGVETEAQRAFLAAEGCYLYQGFLYSPAVTSAKFEEFVSASTANVPSLPGIPEVGTWAGAIVESAVS